MARKRGITREDVIMAAADIADAAGLDAVTLASTAARLGIRSPSLYTHVEGLDGLRGLLALRAASVMAEALEESVRGRSGLAALRELAFGYRRFAKRHPGLYAATHRAVRPGEDDALYEALGAVARVPFRALAEAGFGTAQQVHLTRAFRSALHGFVDLERAGGFGLPESVEESFERMVDVWVLAIRQADATSDAHTEHKE
jgi:AcrR family transcriptional regulator